MGCPTCKSWLIGAIFAYAPTRWITFVVPPAYGLIRSRTVAVDSLNSHYKADSCFFENRERLGYTVLVPTTGASGEEPINSLAEHPYQTD